MAKMQIEINVDGTDVAISMTGTAAPAGGWLAVWDQISNSIKKSLEMREKQQTEKAVDETLKSLAKLIGKTVQETQRPCEATGKDLPLAMIDVAVWHAKKELNK